MGCRERGEREEEGEGEGEGEEEGEGERERERERKRERERERGGGGGGRGWGRWREGGNSKFLLYLSLEIYSGSIYQCSLLSHSGFILFYFSCVR